jgi:hypothetical protein
MANLMISRVCNLHCIFCFAGQDAPQAGGGGEMNFVSTETYEAQLDFLDRSGIDEVRLIGGEPTLHPNFSQLVDIARNRNKQILVFSHGLIPESALICLEALPVKSCTVLINANASRWPAGPTQKEISRRRETLQRLGKRALLGFNIHGSDFELEPYFGLIQETGCQKVVRLGLAHPVSDGQNVFLHPKQYPFIGHKIVKFAKIAATYGIKLDFDCGFVRCMFSKDGLKELERLETDIFWRCNPILDLDINNQAFHCFPLRERFMVQVNPDSTAAECRDSLSQQVAVYRIAGIYQECSSCYYKQQDECIGGCLAHTVRRFCSGYARLKLPRKIV